MFLNDNNNLFLINNTLSENNYCINSKNKMCPWYCLVSSLYNMPLSNRLDFAFPLGFNVLDLV